MLEAHVNPPFQADPENTVQILWSQRFASRGGAPPSPKGGAVNEKDDSIYGLWLSAPVFEKGSA